MDMYKKHTFDNQMSYVEQTKGAPHHYVWSVLHLSLDAPEHIGLIGSLVSAKEIRENPLGVRILRSLMESGPPTRLLFSHNEVVRQHTSGSLYGL